MAKPNQQLMRRAAIAGALLGLVCQLLPTEYQQPCELLLKVASLTCGVGVH